LDYEHTVRGYTMRIILIYVITLSAFYGGQNLYAKGPDDAEKEKAYMAYVQDYIDLLLEYGTDRYGKIHAPILVSILDVETRNCPSDPEPLDEYFRVTRRERRNPAGSNMLTDQAMLRTMHFLSSATGMEKYANFADNYAAYVQKNLVDENGFYWWGWHRHYDVFKDIEDGHSGNHHEIHAINYIDWDRLWKVNQDAVTREIEAIWRLHVINKKTGEINRHGDGKRGCDFSMSAGAYIEAFSFMYSKTKNPEWLDKTRLLVNYYRSHSDPETWLFPERPNAGEDRFDGSSFVTSITGLYCHSLLKAYELTQEENFRDYAVTYLKSYGKYGYDEFTGKFWGALQMDGTPIPGPRVYTDNLDSEAGYAAAQPRGHLDLWEPYVAGYQYAIYTAQAYAYAYHLTGDSTLLTTAKQFASWISKTPPKSIETQNTWYTEYSTGFGQEGTYAGKYGRAISFYLHLHILTDDPQYLDGAQTLANEAIEKLYFKGLFRGHPAKPYYEAMDGVGYLLYALLELDQVLNNPQQVISNRKILLGPQQITMPLDNW
jgi:hypothetical protein